MIPYYQIVSNAIQMASAIHGCPMYQSDECGEFFNDDSNDVFLYVIGFDGGMNYRIRVRDGYEGHTHVKRRVALLEMAMSSLVSCNGSWVNYNPGIMMHLEDGIKAFKKEALT